MAVLCCESGVLDMWFTGVRYGIFLTGHARSIGDMNQDWTLNVFDVVILINRILSGDTGLL